MIDLECNHCGDVAFTSRDIRDGVEWFTDGDGEKCAACGMPGSVSVDGHGYDDEGVTITWVDVQELGVYCERPGCGDCAELRVNDKEAARSIAVLLSDAMADERKVKP